MQAYLSIRLDAIVARKIEESDPRFRSCLSASCENGQVHHNLLDPCVRCKDCGAKSCLNHGIPWHEGYTCASYDNMHPGAISMRTSEERIQTLAKRCPGRGCGFYVEKDGGCDHMYCPRCQQSWYWGTVKPDAEIEYGGVEDGRGVIQQQEAGIRAIVRTLHGWTVGRLSG